MEVPFLTSRASFAARMLLKRRASVVRVLDSSSVMKMRSDWKSEDILSK